MVELLSLPPTAEAITAMAALPGSQLTPMVVGSLRGPDGDLGPEGASAILMLQATFTSPEGSEAFWATQTPLMELLHTSAGFIRSYGFGDGPYNTLIVFWKTVDDAKAFAGRPEHRSAVRDLYKHRWQYSHFAAIWEMVSNHDRVVFCPTAKVPRRCPSSAAKAAEPSFSIRTVRRSKTSIPIGRCDARTRQNGSGLPGPLPRDCKGAAASHADVWGQQALFPRRRSGLMVRTDRIESPGGRVQVKSSTRDGTRPNRPS